MWAKAAELLIKYLIKPLLIDGVVWLYKTIQEYFRKKKLEKENRKKVEAYENAETREDNSDSFSNLP